MPHLVLSDRAVRDLDRIHQFLTEAGNGAAEDAIRTIRRNLPLLLAQPGIGRRLPERPAVREWKIRFGKGAFRVAYVSVADTITILSIQHNRELERQF